MMPDFTETERHMIDSAYNKMETGESITPEEMQLVIRFTAWRAQQEQESQARVAAMQAESAARIEESKRTQEQTRQNLVALSNAALEFYERTCANG